ncbi:Serine/threonine protein kinase [Giardia duodenalis]|uniref:Serine/threonine protein kinase n=1 Tax=Giardia intestinalis TaxID=5741 RepID=V6TGF8_GIAIN|nr:Serine/threonine protein kinase [Giardia intestinalis]
MHAASSGSATTAVSAPQFTIRDLHERLDSVFGRGFTSKVYSLKAIWASL